MLTASIWGLFIGVGGGEHSTFIICFEALCSQHPFGVYWGGGEHSTYITSSALRPTYAHSSHLGFIGGEDLLLTSSALRPYAHTSHLGFIGVGRRNILLIPSALLRLGASLSQKKLPEINIETL